jgi:hypothetical protein
MENIKIGISCGTAWYSKIIEWFSRSKSSHVFFEVTEHNKLMVIGSDENGFVMQTFIRAQGDGSEVKAVYSSEDLDFNLDNCIEFLLETLDEGYDYFGLVGMIWVEVNKWFGKKVSNPLGSSSKYFCSEAAAKCLQSINFPNSESLDPSSIDPETLWEFLEVRKEYVKSLKK